MKLTEITSNAFNICNTLSRCFGLDAENHRTEPLDETVPSALPATALLRGRAAEYRLRSELSQRAQQHDADKCHQTGLLRSDAGEKTNAKDPTQTKSLQEAGESSTHAFDDALNNATPSTLISLLRHLELPRTLSPEQKQKIRYLLDQYHEDTLKESPLIDANGAPIQFQISFDSLPLQHERGRKFHWEVMLDIVTGVKRHLENYSAFRDWQKDNLIIKDIEEKDVAAHAQALVGQQGVFSKQDIERATPICLFGGMLFDDPADQRIDMDIRQLAGCDKYYMRVGHDKKVVEGMDVSMKLNSALTADELPPGDQERNNLSAIDIPIKRENGEELTLTLLCAGRPIKKGEQLCYFYGTGSPDYFSRVRQE